MIPKTFYLLGHEWKVEIVPKETWHHGDDVGFSDTGSCRIEILQSPQYDYMEHTYFHELVHAALDYMGEDKLYRNETFIDLLAGLIHQALVTSEER